MKDGSRWAIMSTCLIGTPEDTCHPWHLVWHSPQKECRTICLARQETTYTLPESLNKSAWIRTKLGSKTIPLKSNQFAAFNWGVQPFWELTLSQTNMEVVNNPPVCWGKWSSKALQTWRGTCPNTNSLIATCPATMLGKSSSECQQKLENTDTTDKESRVFGPWCDLIATLPLHTNQCVYT